MLLPAVGGSQAGRASELATATGKGNGYSITVPQLAEMHFVLVSKSSL